MKASELHDHEPLKVSPLIRNKAVWTTMTVEKAPCRPTDGSFGRTQCLLQDKKSAVPSMTEAIQCDQPAQRCQTGVSVLGLLLADGALDSGRRKVGLGSGSPHRGAHAQPAYLSVHKPTG